MTSSTPTGSTSALVDQLIKQIGQHGAISVTAYMDAVAEAYYARGRVFGRDGDFITSPEISQVFGELVGLWCVTAWQALGQPRNFHLVECGPGRGTLMADALRTVWDVAPVFARSASLHLVERSQALREEQRQNLAAYDIEWHDGLSTLPDGPVIIVANEFLDALPISQFVKTTSGWCERMVTHDGSKFEFTVNSLPSATIDETFYDAPNGSILENSEAVEQVTAEIALLCAERPGIALVIDYGHTVTDVGDTLQAVKNHTFHPALDTPGDADLTAHVDFAAVAQAARSRSASIHGPVEQGVWLKRLGAGVRETQLSEGKSDSETAVIRSSIHRLIDPEGMGSLFKVIAFGPAGCKPLSGFSTGADL
ncbi:MAG: class I SAM-dependent methyltransferase [Alphaproteobacteria bacterium]|nr:class I SAM-dependent methyltransferase [Alphaproteobacteria bacterium]